MNVVPVLWETFWDLHNELLEMYERYKRMINGENVGYDTYADSYSACAARLQDDVFLQRGSYMLLLFDLKTHIRMEREAGRVPDGLYEHLESMLPKSFDAIFSNRVF
jgi:hypothetical protein